VDRLRLVNRRWAVRLAAPAAFLAGVTLALLLVRAGLGEDAPTTTGEEIAATRTTRPTTGTTPGTTAPRPVFATVEAGDTLDQIALDHDTSVERLLELNPDLDPTGLQIGQRIRVR
jgi:LysM repeat protein